MKWLVIARAGNFYGESDGVLMRLAQGETRSPLPFCKVRLGVLQETVTLRRRCGFSDATAFAVLASRVRTLYPKVRSGG